MSSFDLLILERLLTSVLVSDMWCVWGMRRLELDNLAAFLKGAVAYKKKIGFKGAMLLEPKPQVTLAVHHMLGSFVWQFWLVCLSSLVSCSVRM